MYKYLLILLSLISVDAYAVDNFFCDCQAGADTNCAVGSDAADGLTHATARQTQNAARTTFNALPAGDQVRLCRGGAFPITSASYVNTNATTGNPVTFTDYASSVFTPVVDAKPILTLSADASGFDFGSAGIQQGYVFSNLDVRCVACTTNGTSFGFFLFQGNGLINDVTLDNVDVDGFRINVYASNPPGSNLTIRNSNITNSWVIGFLGGTDPMLIEDNYFAANGKNGTPFEHNIYLSSGGNIIVRRNELYQASLDVNGDCATTSLVSHTNNPSITNVLIQNNYVHEDIGKVTAGCWGISVVPGNGGNPETFYNYTFDGNTVVNFGGAHVRCTSCQNPIFENNVSISYQTFDTSGVYAGPGPAEDGLTTNVTMRNNVSYFGPNVNSATGAYLRSTTGTNVMVSNASYYDGTGAFGCINVGGTVTDNTVYTDIDNNVCFYPNTGSGEFSSSYGNLAAWRTASIFGDASQNVDPGYTNPVLFDLSSASGTSGMVGSGHATLSSPTAIFGQIPLLTSVTRGTSPDSGGYQFTTQTGLTPSQIRRRRN